MDKKELAKFIGKKIRIYRTNMNLTQEELGKKLNTKKATISNYETGYRTPKQDDLFQIANVLNINIDDLFPERQGNSINITTIYNKLTPPRQQRVLAYAKHQLSVQLEDDDKVINFNSKLNKQSINVNGYASAGTGEMLLDDILFQVEYNGFVPPHDIALQVNGDSMEPMFEDKEIIFVEKTNAINSGQVGVFIISGEAYVKKVFIGDDHIRLVSLNKKYSDIYISENKEIKLVGRVIL